MVISYLELKRDRGIANVVPESYWLRNLLRERQQHITTATHVYRDNVCIVYLAWNYVHRY